MKNTVLIFSLAFASPLVAFAQQPTTTQDQDQIRLKLPPVTVVADKVPEDVQKTPVSVTAVTHETIESSVPRSVSDAADLAPNTWFNEFSARKLSNPRFRGIGSSPNNPGVTTYIDGVPQLNANSSSLELADIDQIEFVRGPQSALYGRNNIGGLINISSVRPSLGKWTGSLVSPFGNFGAADIHGSISGPVLQNRAAVSAALGYSSRDGYTVNDISGNDLDSRSAFFSKSQFLFTPNEQWEARAIVTTERARDGDYALNDIDALRARPYHAARDYEGFTNRDVVAPTILVRRAGPKLDLTSTTGFVWWTTDDSTDLDYTPFPLARRDNHEEDLQFTQEVRVSSNKSAPMMVGNASLAWQAGLFLFTQGYDQDAVNAYSPFVLSQFINFAVQQHSPQAALDDWGVGGYGRGTFTFKSNFDLSLGVRVDHENKQASLSTFYNPPIAPTVTTNEENTFNDVSPQVTFAYRSPKGPMFYMTAAKGFKAGGFNPVALPGSESYGVETSWNYEGGVKSTFANDRVSLNGDVFFIQWDDMQVNVANPFIPGSFYIANAGNSSSKGVEFELATRLFAGCDFFAGTGYTNARFDDGTLSNGAAVGGNRISNTPLYTVDFGGQYSTALSSKASVFARAEVVLRGEYFYDDANTESQDAYTVSNFRGGVRGRYLFGEMWIRNAFNTNYIPLAFSYPGLAPSGFIGEMGAPRTFGARVGVNF